MTMDVDKNEHAQNARAILVRRLSLFAFALFLAFIFWSSVTLQQIFFTSVDSISEFVETNRLAGLLIFVGLAALSSMLSPFSSIPMVPVAVMVFGSTFTLFLLILGWTIGAILTYLIGILADRAILRYLASFEKINYYKNKISAHSRFWMIVIFRLALPAEITGYSLGILRYPFGRYLGAVLIAEIPFATLAVYSSKAFLDQQIDLFVALVVLGAGLVYYLVRIFRQKINSKSL